MSTSPTTNILTGRLRPFSGIDPSWPARKQERAEHVLRLVREASPALAAQLDEGEVPDADHEDFWEDAYRVAAALVASRAHGAELVVDFADERWWTEGDLSSRLGSVSIREEGSRHAPDRQLLHPLVLKHGERSFARCTLGRDVEAGDSASFPDLAEHLVQLHLATGAEHAVLKSADHKGGVWLVPIGADREQAQQGCFEALGWTALRLEGRPGGVVAQEHLPLEHEYRLFVVDGELVSGAGCVEEHTPLDRQGSTSFDDRMRRRRGILGDLDEAQSDETRPSPVTSEPELLERYLAFGRRLAEEHAGTVVIDVAINAWTEEPVVVELNSLPNSGLYASDAYAVFHALAGARDRGYSELIDHQALSSGMRRDHQAALQSEVDRVSALIASEHSMSLQPVQLAFSPESDDADPEANPDPHPHAETDAETSTEEH